MVTEEFLCLVAGRYFFLDKNTACGMKIACQFDK